MFDAALQTVAVDAVTSSQAIEICVHCSSYWRAPRNRPRFQRTPASSKERGCFFSRYLPETQGCASNRAIPASSMRSPHQQYHQSRLERRRLLQRAFQIAATPTMAAIPSAVGPISTHSPNVVLRLTAAQPRTYRSHSVAAFASRMSSFIV